MIMIHDDGYSLKAGLLKLSPEEYTAAKKELFFLSVELPEEQQKLSDYWGGETIVDEAGISIICKYHPDAKFKRVKGLLYNHPAQQKETIQQVTQIHVANLGLFAIERLLLLEDACTNEINEMISGDWKIIAVIPANDARRPTYILGTSKPST